MAENLVIPKLGMAMVDANIVEWKFKEGDEVEKGEVVLTIETEKTKWDVEADASGFIHIMVPADTKVVVGRVVGLIARSQEELQTLQKQPVTEMFVNVKPPLEEKKEDQATASIPAAVNTRERIKISPVARKMAEENMIDITTVTGTGPDGRIIREDIEKTVADKAAKKATPAAPAKEAAPVAKTIDFKHVKTTIPVKGMRKAIAQHMHNSLAITAQLTRMSEVDMSEIVKIREAMLTQEKAIGVRISYTDILVFTIAKALKAHTLINSSLIGDEIVIWDDINIGVAVAVGGGLESGLIVPVVRNAGNKSIIEISRDVKALTEKARSGKLLPDDVSCGTFTLTNLGAFSGGYGFETPIINQPQSAILGTGTVTERVLARNGQVVIRPVMAVSFTYDHRVIDGAPAAMFMGYLTQLLENPGLLLL